jgi:hypothetical protein
MKRLLGIVAFLLLVAAAPAAAKGGKKPSIKAGRGNTRGRRKRYGLVHRWCRGARSSWSS